MLNNMDYSSDYNKLTAAQLDSEEKEENEENSNN